jgi:hypothetical protein
MVLGGVGFLLFLSFLAFNWIRERIILESLLDTAQKNYQQFLVVSNCIVIASVMFSLYGIGLLAIMLILGNGWRHF